MHIWAMRCDGPIHFISQFEQKYEEYEHDEARNLFLKPNSPLENQNPYMEIISI